MNDMKLNEVTLPISETAVTAPSPTRENGTAAFIPGKPAVLIIDDNEAICKALSDILSIFLEVIIFTAGNGREGLQIFQEQQQHIVLVILDIEMPVMNGPQTYDQLQQLAPHVNVVVSSGLSPGEARSQFREGKQPTFLPKPYSVKDLITVLQPLLELKQRPEA